MSLLPTHEVYAELQLAYEHFNVQLFDGQLPDCLITLQRERRTYGYFSRKRFARRSGEMTDEIAMNPGYFAIRSLRKTLSVLAHEMVHLWQFHFGAPGRRGYHNKEWAARMEALGLMPSNTGAPGGKRLGEQMDHYIIPGGRFDVSCAELLTRDFSLSWYDRFPPERPQIDPPTGSNGRGFVDDVDGEDEGQGQALDQGGDELGPLGELVELPPEVPPNRSNRVKYRCPKCATQVWGKPELAILCGGEHCAGSPFQPVAR
ncbi:SprT-like domain-containing protein [Pseudomonas putida]|uniref:Mpr n=1 Tax=Pseudomonas sp. CT14 TaxID=341029 RepID=Q2QCR4_9PSED|nr:MULTISPECIES: SprT-like domain-containing protein [Pseudomonas]PZP01473.1 MAG: sprT domain-containing protein [Pseudomonas protegens]HCA1452712.1 SprT-like domain-containing protein [Klebsiella pneumoniae]ABA25965.1 Mpr [Pseudomonas sp. CT14]EKT8057282.1 SprT-like domain-containing protein [Pseudomonas aeruginosa]EKX3903740.1 SprT-like domain-containing protein [Pseudomonas aeruginosa]